MRCQCLVELGKPVVGMERERMEVSGTEVLLRVKANGVCHSDLHIREGYYQLAHGKKLVHTDRGLKLPVVMGHEPAGVIVEAGPEAGELDRSKNYLVFPWLGCGTCHKCLHGLENQCSNQRFIGVMLDGGYAEYIKVPHPRYIFDLGDLDPARAAPLACSGVTTFSAMKKVQEEMSRSPVVIIGAGGLGLMSIGMVKALGGLPPIVVDVDPKKLEAAQNLGAAAVVNAKADDAIEQIHKMIGGPAASVVDFVGSEQSTTLGFDVLDKGGKFVMVGLFGGTTPWSLPLIPLKSISIIGSCVGTLKDFGEMMELAVAGRIPLPPTTSYPLEDANHVLDLLQEGKIVGRAVLVP